MLIDLNTYYLFLKHGSECLWTSDHRVPRPKGTSPETDQMFDILEYVDHRFEMIHTGMYSVNFVAIYQKDIARLKKRLCPKVLHLIEQKYI